VTVINWLVPDAEDAKRPRPAVDPTMLRPPMRIVETANGPASTHLLTLLVDAGLDGLLPGTATPILTDRKSPRAPVAGCVTYQVTEHSAVFAVQQQMMHPYPYSVVGLTDGAQLTRRPTGSLLVSYPSRATNQVFLISAFGVMTTLTATGVHVPAPLTIDQLVGLATAIDSRPSSASVEPG